MTSLGTTQLRRSRRKTVEICLVSNVTDLKQTFWGFFVCVRVYFQSFISECTKTDLGHARLEQKLCVFEK